jgi:hypothetical protein
MENRIRQQEAAIHILKNESRDTTDAERRLTLLHAVSQEMRIQLAHLVGPFSETHDSIGLAHEHGIDPVRSRKFLVQESEANS